jgi:hypothetical protein
MESSPSGLKGSTRLSVLDRFGDRGNNFLSDDDKLERGQTIALVLPILRFAWGVRCTYTSYLNMNK